MWGILLSLLSKNSQNNQANDATMQNLPSYKSGSFGSSGLAKPGMKSSDSSAAQGFGSLLSNYMGGR